MNNERYNQIIDEAYENYYEYMRDDRQWEMSKEEFINKIKTDVEFAKKWGLTIYTEVEGDEVYMGIVYNGNAAKIKIK
jgi:hypothetical protein